MVLVFAHRICAWRNTFVLSWLGCYPAPVIESKQERLRQDCWWPQHSYLQRVLPGLLLAQENIRNSARRHSCYASTENAGWCNLDEDKARGSRSLRIKDRKQDPFIGGQVGNWEGSQVFPEAGRVTVHKLNWEHVAWSWPFWTCRFGFFG